MPPLRAGLLISILTIAALLLSACGLTANQVAGIYTGAISEASDITVETWLQLFSDGSFKQREIRYLTPTSTKFREGRWTIKGNLIVLVINGEKDIRLIWEHYFLRNEVASQAHPQLPLDMVALQRIGQ